jgi:hypothetical protein
MIRDVQPDPDLDFLLIPDPGVKEALDPGVKKARDPGSGSATLSLKSKPFNLIFL